LQTAGVYTDQEIKHPPDRLRVLNEISCAAIIALNTRPRVRRHMPLAKGPLSKAAGTARVAGQRERWAQNGYRQWAFRVGRRDDDDDLYKMLFFIHKLEANKC
jgi:hypothetical protein